jgi:dolichol-phosphate mannosyltransferase
LQYSFSPLLIIVNYNQEKEIGGFLRLLFEKAPQIDKVLVDDGSTDQSKNIALAHGMHVIEHTTNRGVGAAIRSGIHYAQTHEFSHVIIMSSNGKMVPQDLDLFLAAITTGQYDYVTGSRFIAGGSSPGLSLFRSMMIPIFSRIASLLLFKKFTDITCGYRAYRIDFLGSEPIDIEQSWLNKYEMEYYIHYWACRKNLKILEVPVTIPYTHLEASRKSKIKPITGWWSMMRPFLYLTLGIKR